MNLRLSCTKTIAQGTPKANGWDKKYFKDGSPNYGVHRRRTLSKATVNFGGSVIKDAKINKCEPMRLKENILGMGERMVGFYQGKKVMRTNAQLNTWAPYDAKLFA